jgi:hypothetical protein
MLRSILLVILLVFAFPGWSSSTPTLKEEIDHLLQFIENSGCTFDRNGSLHASDKAREHIEHKYGFVESKVDSAESFIKYTASSSSISKKPYHVICDGQRIASKAWLEAELDSYREQEKAL